MQAERTMPRTMNNYLSSSSDEDLLKGISRKDKAALDSLYMRYGQRLFAYALRLTENPAMAEDVLQEGLLIVWRKARTFRGEGSVLSWLLGIIRIKALQTYRQKPLDSIEESDIEIPDDSISLETRVSSQEQDARVRAALQRLSPEHREVLELIFYQGLSQREVAQVCKCPVGTVKSRLSYARQQLRGILTRDGLQPKDAK